MTFVLSKRAQTDIDDIALYTLDNFGPVKAKNTLAVCTTSSTCWPTTLNSGANGLVAGVDMFIVRTMSITA